MKKRPELWLGYVEHEGVGGWFVIATEEEANTRARAGQDVQRIVSTETYRPAPSDTSGDGREVKP